MRNISIERVCKQIMGHTKDITDDIQRLDASFTALQVDPLMMCDGCLVLFVSEFRLSF